jgi:hypothetical protein
MSEIENEVVDLSWEHARHLRFESKCSACFTEEATSMTHEELVDDRDGHYEGSPVGGWDR